MGDLNLPIDITFNVYSDSGGKDPDSHSPTLKKYHKILWNVYNWFGLVTNNY